MLIAARQARTANTHAPLQERAATATGRIRDLFRPSMRYWAHARSTQQMSGAVAAVLDASGRGVTIDQATASKQPLAGSTANVRGWVFDGVNDCLQTPTVTLSDTTQVTLAIVCRPATTAASVLLEMSTNWTSAPTAMLAFANNSGTNLMMMGMKSTATQVSYKEWTQPVGNWHAQALTFNIPAPVADETRAYRDGSQITNFFANFNFDCTAAAMGNFPHFIGSRANGIAFPLNGTIAAVLLLGQALSAPDASTLTGLLRQASGVV